MLLIAGGIGAERISADCGVMSRRCYFQARENRWPCLRLPVDVAKESERSIGRVAELPVSLLTSAAVPVAVFSVPVVLNKSARADCRIWNPP